MGIAQTQTYVTNAPCHFFIFTASDQASTSPSLWSKHIRTTAQMSKETMDTYWAGNISLGLFKGFAGLSMPFDLFENVSLDVPSRMYRRIQWARM